MPRPCPVVQWSVHWAPSWTTWVPVLAGQGIVPLRHAEKKMGAPLLGLAKSIYYLRKFLTIVIYEDYIGLSNPYQ